MLRSLNPKYNHQPKKSILHRNNTDKLNQHHRQHDQVHHSWFHYHTNFQHLCVQIHQPKEYSYQLTHQLQAYHLGFQTLKVQKHATQIHDDLKNITSRFVKHFDGIKNLRKKLEDAMKVTDDFGRDARSITRTLENIGDPEQIEKVAKEENVEKVDFKDKTNVS